QRRLNVFSRVGSGYRIRRSLRVDVAIRDMCFLGATLVAHAPATTDSHALAVLDTTGQVSSRFGPVYRSPNGLVNYTFAQGRIACDLDNGLIVYGPRAGIGEVRSYRRDGSPVWRVKIDDIRSN